MKECIKTWLTLKYTTTVHIHTLIYIPVYTSVSMDIVSRTGFKFGEDIAVKLRNKINAFERIEMFLYKLEIISHFNIQMCNKFPTQIKRRMGVVFSI